MLTRPIKHQDAFSTRIAPEGCSARTFGMVRLKYASSRRTRFILKSGCKERAHVRKIMYGADLLLRQHERLLKWRILMVRLDSGKSYK